MVDFLQKGFWALCLEFNFELKDSVSVFLKKAFFLVGIDELEAMKILIKIKLLSF